MSWSSDFADGIASREVPTRWAIRTVQMGSEACWSGTAYVAAVYPQDGDPILRGPPSCTGARVSIDTWTSTLASWSFELAGDLTEFRANVTRGTCMEILLYAGGAVERVSFGRVQSVTAGRGVVTLTIGDPTSVLDGRSVSEGSKVPLFYGLLSANVATTSLTADYTAGDPTITVGSTAGFTYDPDGVGALQLDTFLLTYDPSATTATTFDVSTAGELATTAADVASGGDVREVALLQGNPIAIALKVLTSTGAGTNGTYDTYSVGWGFGVPASFVAIDDAELEISQVVHLETAGTYTASIIVTEAQVDPRGWLVGWLSAFGCYLACFEGRLTVRGVTLNATRHRSIRYIITDADLDPSQDASSEWWDSSAPIEAAMCPVACATLTIDDGDEALETLPGVYTDTIDLAAYLYSYTYYGEVMTEVYNRVWRTRKRIGEVVTLPVAGLGLLGLCPGDQVTYQSDRTDFRFSYAGLGRSLYVVQVSPDPRSGRVIVRGITYGPDGEVFA